ncbi:MAG: polyketide synthase dehydratase domain-containing protein, partial [Anaerolineales bacterium]|nr:polyketide synthase dehydratase domain-containing protein [Anaerolineales bacterium]
GLKLIAERGRLMQALPRDGAMAALFTAEERVRAALAPHAAEVSIAAVNGPANVVISGVETAVQAIIDALAAEGVKARRLVVSHAFHSPLMAPMLDMFEAVAATVTYNRPRIGLISNVSGALVRGDEVSSAAYWRAHVRQAVRFQQGLEALHAQGVELFVEVGPHPTLLGMGRRILPADAGVWLPSLRRDKGDWLELLGSLAGLYAAGVDVDWAAFDAPYARRKVALPTYPFQRERYWFEVAAGGPRRAAAADAHPLLGQRVPTALQAVQFEAQVSAQAPSFLAQRRLNGRVLLPESALLEVALAAADAADGGADKRMAAVWGLRLLGAAVELARGPRLLQTVLRQTGAAEAALEIHALAADGAADGAWQLLAEGTAVQAAAAADVELPALEAVQARCAAAAVADWLARLADGGLVYQDRFQVVDALWRGAGEALARLRPPADAAAYRVHPALLEAAAQLLAAGETAVYQIAAVQTLRVWDGGEPVWAYAAADGLRQAQPADKRIAAVDGGLHGDVWLLDAAGQPVAALLGLRMAAVEAAAAAAADVHEWIYEVAWQPLEPAAAVADARPAREPGQWLILADAGGVGAALAARLAAVGETAVLARPASAGATN